MTQTSLPLQRRRCFYCVWVDGQPMRYLDEPHPGPCGLPCLGGVTYEELDAMPDDEVEAFVQRHHAANEYDPCLRCEEMKR